MSESNATALVPVSPPQHAPARIAERPSALSADKLPGSRTNVQTTSRQQLQPGEPPRLTSDGKVSNQWMSWMIARNKANRMTASQDVAPQAGYDDKTVEYNMALIDQLIEAPEHG